MLVIHFSAGDLLVMKKPHPCGSNIMRVMRVGSDVRVKCMGCSRDMTLDRVKLERAIKKVISDETKGDIPCSTT